MESEFAYAIVGGILYLTSVIYLIYRYRLFVKYERNIIDKIKRTKLDDFVANGNSLTLILFVPLYVEKMDGFTLPTWLVVIPALIFCIPAFVFLRKKKKIYKDLPLEITPKTTQSRIGDEQGSYFDGGLFSLVRRKILGLLITVVTLGICYPLALCMVYGWETNHTVINGKRLQFHGKAASLFGHWLLWLLLIIVTLGIYSFWVPIAIKKWITKNTTFLDCENKPSIVETQQQKCRRCGKTCDLGYTGCPHCGAVDFE